MNKLKALIIRNLKETIRDPICTIFNIAFPTLLFLILNLVFKGAGFTPDNFNLINFTPGITVLAYSFLMLTCSMTIAGDKTDLFMTRILVSPVKFSTYVLSQIISCLPIVAFQTILLYSLGFAFGLPFTIKTLVSAVYLLPSAIFYILLGILIGLTVKNVKNAGPICSVLINVISLLGGVFLPLEILSGAFKTLVNILPFSHTTLISSGVFKLGFSSISPHIFIILAYSLLITILITLVSKKIMKKY